MIYQIIEIKEEAEVEDQVVVAEGLLGNQESLTLIPSL
jgi:hypothetical protein